MLRFNNVLLNTCTVHSAGAMERKQANGGLDSETVSSKIRILVVDDQVAVALMMVFLLTRAGCDAQAATNAEKALRLAQTETFNLIILDVGMPDLNGFQLFQKLRHIPHLKGTPVVFVSGNATIENQQHALDLGAADFIEKPFGTQDFVSRILSLIEEPR
jgi:DNA-binding response OmpR family regulator